MIVWPSLASGYDCTYGGEQVARTGVMRLGYPPGGRIVILDGETSRSEEDRLACGGEVRVEGWIDGDPYGAMAHQAWNVARLGYPGTGPWMGIPCPANWYSGNTKHFFVPGWPWSWVTIELKYPAVIAPDACPPPPPSEQELCEAQGAEYYWNGSECVFTPGSPIIVDTARNGYKLTSVDEGVRFDLNVDGVLELVAWTHADSDDAFLAIDRNGNGKIDDGSELFGNYTRAYADRDDVRTRNGFEALKFAEGPSYGTSNGDGTLDARDGVFGRLLLWRDLNHNGISEPDELQSVAGSGVASIGTEYKERRKVDRYGNEFRQKGRIFWVDGVEDALYDVWLKWRP
jgi:hypothetical protein